MSLETDMLGEKFPSSYILNGKELQWHKAEKKEVEKNILRFVNYSEVVSRGRKGWLKKGFPPVLCHVQNILLCLY